MSMEGLVSFGALLKFLLCWLFMLWLADLLWLRSLLLFFDLLLLFDPLDLLVVLWFSLLKTTIYCWIFWNFLPPPSTTDCGLLLLYIELVSVATVMPCTFGPNDKFTLCPRISWSYVCCSDVAYPPPLLFRSCCLWILYVLFSLEAGRPEFTLAVLPALDKPLAVLKPLYVFLCVE